VKNEKAKEKYELGKGRKGEINDCSLVQHDFSFPKLQ